MRDRFQTLLVILVLLGVGALLGSFWLEWRHARLAEEASAAARNLSAEPEPRLRVEVLNGAGDRGAAQHVAERLREVGFDVVYFGNAGSFGHTTSVAINRSGRAGAAGEVAMSLGIDSLETRIDADLYLDVTVILGDDWRSLEPDVSPGR